MKFADRLDRFGEEIFASLNNKKLELEAQGRKIYNLSVGTPDFKTPEHIRKALTEAAADPENWKYALRDLPELLEAVCAYYKKRYGVTIETEQVMSCYGTQEGVGHLALALCNKGDVAGVAGLAPVRDGRHVGSVCFQEHAAIGYDGRCIANVLCVLERDDAGKPDVDVRVEGEERFRESWCAGKAVHVDVFVAEVGAAQYGERVVVRFAQVEHDGFTACECQLQVALE